jgi:hypothetical protein
MRKSFSERSLLVMLYMTLLFGSGLVPEQVKHVPLGGKDCQPVPIQSVS